MYTNVHEGITKTQILYLTMCDLSCRDILSEIYRTAVHNMTTAYSERMSTS